jgi:hypothetical protein
MLSDRQWGTEHQYLLSCFLCVSILQLLIAYRIYDYDMSLRFESRVVMSATSFGMFGTSLLPVVATLDTQDTGQRQTSKKHTR